MSHRTTLLYGPYEAPQFRLGQPLRCSLRKERVVVDRISGGPIPWPAARTAGKPQLVLCGDLIRAVRRESSAAVQFWWGVSEWTVTRWRNALGVGRFTEGTLHLWQTRNDVLPLLSAAKLRSLRTTQGLSMRELGERIEVSSSVVRSYESADRHAKPRRVAQFCEVLGCRQQDLLA